MISLIPFDKTGFEQLILWAADEETLMQFAGPSFNFPLTASQLELSLADKKRLAYQVVHMPGQTIIGHAEIYLPGEATIVLNRILIGATAFRGRGIGLQVVKQLLQLAFNLPGIEEAILNVFDRNLPAIKCYEKAGFRISKDKTKTRQVNNQTWTALNMYLDKRTWENVRENT